MKTFSFVIRKLESIQVTLLQQLMNLQGVPSVQMHEVPPEFELRKAEAETEARDGEEDEMQLGFADVTKKQHEAEFYDSVD